MKNRKLILVLLGILILGLCAYLAFDFFSTGEKTSYRTFMEHLAKEEVSTVTLSGDALHYTLTSGSTRYVTDNPHSLTLREELLLANVAVKDNSEDSLTTLFDMLFNLFFFGLIFFGLYKLISYSTKTFHVVKHTGVHFSDIAGMDNLKKDMLYAVEILKDMKKAKANGVRETRGIILEGAPGNGKTMFAKALAEEADVNFIATKGADFQGAVMGLGAFKVKMLFNKARRKKPCIIFIDEFDSIGERRNYAGSGIDKENNRIITTLLNEMDGFTHSSGVLVIAATNSYASLDEALVRPGRFDLKYTVGNPDAETRKQLVTIYSKGKTVASDLTPEVLSVVFDGLSSAAIEAVLNEAQNIAKLYSREAIDLACIAAAGQKTATKLNIKIKKN